MTTEGKVWLPRDVAAALLAPSSDSHKYSRGVLGLRTGSASYPGAAVLSAEAAWRTGVGLVHYIAPFGDARPEHGLPTPAAAILATRPETVFSHDDAVSRARCDAWTIGSGTDPADRSVAETEALTELLRADAPVVVDAGALDLIAKTAILAPVIITPHRGELSRLWHDLGLGDMPENAPDAAAAVAARCDVTVLVKGSRTTIVTPDGWRLVVGPATAWLATAGTGDVLAGIVGSLLAMHAAERSRSHLSTQGRSHQRLSHEDLARLAATAALLHDRAARLASHDPDAKAEGHPITALDVAHAIPQTIAQLLNCSTT